MAAARSAVTLHGIDYRERWQAGLTRRTLLGRSATIAEGPVKVAPLEPYIKEEETRRYHTGLSRLREGWKGAIDNEHRNVPKPKSLNLRYWVRLDSCLCVLIDIGYLSSFLSVDIARVLLILMLAHRSLQLARAISKHSFASAANGPRERIVLTSACVPRLSQKRLIITPKKSRIQVAVLHGSRRF